VIVRLIAVSMWLAVVYSAHALEFSIGSQLKSGERLLKPAILMEGEIREGDAARFVSFLKANRQVVVDQMLSIVPNSPGGSIVEATKLASVIESGMLGVWLPPPLSYPDRSKQARCASSCFMLVVGASSRVLANQAVGLHRPYFERSVYDSASTAQVVNAHERLLQEMRSWLHSRGVPSQLIEKMMLHSSQEIYWMNDEDVDALGRVRPAVEELMIANCSFDKTLLERWTKAALAGASSAASLAAKLDEQGKCTERVRRSALLAFLNL